ncbi:cbb3-type cytochrome c oxidase subunit I [Vibrio lentus]|nr:cbb3-type cytochrome c oxidase subunit I [Vibrio lentus]
MFNGGGGHNAVGLLTAGVIGMNYHFIPKAADRPIYSYRRLSFIFGAWSASTHGPGHHLVYSSVPIWIQNIDRDVNDPVAPSPGRVLSIAQLILLQNKEKLKP